MPYRTAPLQTPNMPPGIPFIIGNEFAERFSFYGMRAILMMFMTTALVNRDGALDLMDREQASTWIHAYIAAAYWTPLLGGLIADLLLGKYRTIITLSLVYCCGHLVLAIDHTRTGLFLGLALVSLGAGGIKPCVASHVGDQFGKTNAGLMARVYYWFYLSINVGSTLSMLLTPWLLRHWGPHWAFGVPGILMLVATIIFWLGRHRFAHIPAEPRRFWSDLRQPGVIRSLLGLAIIYLFVAMFWSLFDQTASRWVDQATHMDLRLFGIEMLPDQMQSINPILVLIFVPLFSLWLYPFCSRFVKVTPLRKIAAGFFIAIPSFAIPAMVEDWIEQGMQPSIWWQVLAYVFMTAAEVMISITCLEFSYTQAPARLKSFVMSLYYALSVGVGNIFTSAVNASIKSFGDGGALTGPGYYWFFTQCIAGTALLFLAVAWLYKGQSYYQDEAVEEAPEKPVLT